MCTQIGKRRLYTKREIIYKTIKKHRIHKIENKNTKQTTNIERILKNISPVIRK
jgi:hypothetical protein